MLRSPHEYRPAEFIISLLNKKDFAAHEGEFHELTVLVQVVQLHDILRLWPRRLGLVEPSGCEGRSIYQLVGL